jgi:ABC-type uncharacterized transport system auxiliary subunit
MIKAGKTLIPLLLAIVLGVSCTSLIGGKTEIPERRKFTLVAHPLNLRLKNSKRPYLYNLQIKKFSVSGNYDRDQIVFRLSPFEIKDDKRNIWADRPSKMITDVIEEYLNQANMFTNISQEYLDRRPDYVLSGTVRAIERFDSGDAWYAHLSLSWKLVDAKTNEIFWDDDFDRTEPLYQRDMSITVEAMSQTLREEIEKAIVDLDWRFANKWRQESGIELLEQEQAANGDNGPVTADADSTDATYGADSDYELLPGRLAP